MRPSEVFDRLEAIARACGDSEVAHSLEDELYADVLEAIAQGRCTDPAGCAALALRTKNFDFERWCA